MEFIDFSQSGWPVKINHIAKSHNSSWAASLIAPLTMAVDIDTGQFQFNSSRHKNNLILEQKKTERRVKNVFLNRFLFAYSIYGFL